MEEQKQKLNNEQQQEQKYQQTSSSSSKSQSSSQLQSQPSLPNTPQSLWQWLLHQCDRAVTYSSSGVPVLSCFDISSSMLQLLQSQKSDEAIQSDALDLLGFEHIELVGELLANRKQLKTIKKEHCKDIQPDNVKSTFPSDSSSNSSQFTNRLVGVSIQSSAQKEMDRA